MTGRIGGAVAGLARAGTRGGLRPWLLGAALWLVPVAGVLGAQPVPCARFDVPWWMLTATRFLQTSGSGPRTSGATFDRHYVDRRVLRRTATGYRLELRRIRLGLSDLPAQVVVEYAPSGAVVRITGDVEALAKDVAPLTMKPCAALQSGVTWPDLGGRSDTLRTPLQRSITRSVAARPVTVGAIDSLGGRLAVVEARRYVTDTARGDLTRQRPNQPAEILHPWTVLSGDEVERQFVRVQDGMVLFRERVRHLAGRGWVPPHDVKDTVQIRVESRTVERIVDSASADLVLAFSRRGERSVSATTRDTVALHYREWRGDTLVLRQFRRSGARDELRTVWRDSLLVGVTLVQPGTALQDPGPIRRVLVVADGALHDSGSREPKVSLPSNPWSIALDGYEDVLAPALLGVPADSVPHRFSMYGMQGDSGAWLHWNVSVLPRGAVRVARFTTLQQQWVGSVIFTPTGELLLMNFGGQAGATRLPASGTRLEALLEQQRGIVSREDMIPPGAAPPSSARPASVP
ncbi:MAG: hypothetical protein IT355_06295 [Gemmatimonadaceae bacterium]|nr:hypothetical protein [Gemmatimonadaceae bacterium]